MTEKRDRKTFVAKIMPRVLRAIIMGTIMFFLYYLLPTLLFSQFFTGIPSEYASHFIEYEQLFYIFAAIIICFAVLIQLASGTIVQHALSIAKAIVLMMYFIYALNGGILTLSIPVGEETVNIMANFTAFLVILISVNLLALAKSMLEAINFLSRKVSL